MINKIFKKIYRSFSALISFAKPIRASAANKVVYSYIDVSAWQLKIDWAKVKAAGIQGVIIRAGIGDVLSYPGQKDEYYEYNYSECKRLGIPVGAYFYCYAKTAAEAQREARGCLKLLAGKQFELPILYDVEEQTVFSKGHCNEVIKAFADILEAAGWWVGVYTYKCAADAYLNDRTKTRYTMAVAQYASVCTYTGPYAIWQNSSTTRVDGISGNVDHDWCYEDFPTEIKAKGKNGFSPPAPKPGRVAATHSCYTYDSDKKGNPAVNGPYKAGSQWTIEKTIDYCGIKWGKIKGSTMWVRMSDVKYI